MSTKYNPFEKFALDWAVVTAGNKDHFNMMTIAWGAMGTIWKKPVIIVFVRPERHTNSFIKNNEYFTVSFFNEEFKDHLRLLGSKSGKNFNKMKESGLTPIFKDNGIIYEEAEETFICKKIYNKEMKKENFPQDVLHFYGEDGFPHDMFIGEVVSKIKK
mgnify:CR=1 FL=1